MTTTSVTHKPASLHTARAIAAAAKKGAYSATEPATPLWNLSKRELIEIALHIAAQNTGQYEEALDTGEAAERALEELTNLRQAGLV